MYCVNYFCHGNVGLSDLQNIISDVKVNNDILKHEAMLMGFLFSLGGNCGKPGINNHVDVRYAAVFLASKPQHVTHVGVKVNPQPVL